MIAVTSILPALGHTGGRTFIEISGSGFRLPPDPPAGPNAPAPIATVRVLFGGVPATDVAIAGSDLVWCKTPIHDPGPVDVTVQSLDQTPASLQSAPGTFALNGGESCTVEVNGVAQPFTVGAVADPGAATPLELAVQLNQLAGVQVTVEHGHVLVRTDLRGPGASLRFTGTAVTNPMGLPSTKAVGSAELEPVESIVLPQAYRFVRPDITVESQPTLALKQLMIELERQVIPNVNFASDTDFDDDTGDLLNSAYLAKIPAIVLAGLEVVPSPGAQSKGTQLVEGEGGRKVEKRAPEVIDMTMMVILVASTAPEALNLYAIMRSFITKNPSLAVPTGLGTATKAHNLDFRIEVPAGVAVTSDGSNIVTMTGAVAIRRVQLLDIPLEQTELPAGHPQDQPHEATTGGTWAQTQVEVEVVPKDVSEE